VTTQNARLAAIHTLFGYAALSAPEHAALIARVLALRVKRCDRKSHGAHVALCSADALGGAWR